jgi:hypothetical protein
VSSDPTPADVSPPREPSDPAQLAEELAREKEEVLRLRGLLVARDAELGAARGRVLELETRARYVLGALRRLRAFPERAREMAAGLRGSRS